jgi:hypothetical protein
MTRHILAGTISPCVAIAGAGAQQVGADTRLRSETRDIDIPGLGMTRVSAGWLRVPENRQNPTSRSPHFAGAGAFSLGHTRLEHPAVPGRGGAVGACPTRHTLWCETPDTSR